jgi:hypothetical protein
MILHFYVYSEKHATDNLYFSTYRRPMYRSPKNGIKEDNLNVLTKRFKISSEYSFVHTHTHTQ